MAVSHPPSDPSRPVWTAGAVARRLGVAPATLRSWSRRYGIGPAAHTPGRHRRYSAADLAEIDAMRALVAQGMALPAAAAVIRGQRSGSRSRSSPSARKQAAPARADPATELAGAAARLDRDRAVAILDGSLAEYGVIPTWDRLCRPAFGILDTAVARDLGCTDAQLLLSWVITSCLRRLPVPPPSRSGQVLLACAAREQHTLPLEVLFAALTERQVPATMLGPAVPPAALLHAARELRPEAIVVWSHRAATAEPALLREVVTCAETVVAAGPGWRDVALPPAVFTADDLLVALALSTHPASG